MVSPRFNWARVLAAVVAAEALPILGLVIVVFVYGFTRQASAPSPEEFAPIAGKWVGPIGGFLATMLMGLWAARRSPHQPMAHGTAVGVGTALLDFSLAMLLGGGGPIDPLLLLSNGGRLLAGWLGGWLASRGSAQKQFARAADGKGTSRGTAGTGESK
jgi:hypothetical protein